MADDITNVGDLSVDQTAYDRFLYYALRARLVFDQVATVKPTAQSMPGSAVKFTLVSDLAVASTALDESTDVDAVAMADSQVTLTLAEYGNAVKTTALLRGTSFVALDPAVANVVSFNAAKSLDTIARDKLKAGSNIRYATGGSTTPTARNTVEPGDTIASDDIRRMKTDLAAADVDDFGGFYVAYIHPDVSHDLRSEAGNTSSWREPSVYGSSQERLWNGTIGRYEGFEFIETTQAPVFADAGSSTTLTDVYATIGVGREALAKAHSYTDGNGAYPKMVITPVTDNLRRFLGFGWYWLGTYGIFRSAAVRRLESSSSVGTNS
jgi:N4-gp56 family major capsid protein